MVSAEKSKREERILEHLRGALSYMRVQKEGTDLSRSTWKIPVPFLSEPDDSQEQLFKRIHSPKDSTPDPGSAAFHRGVFGDLIG
jgi:hypothetical protein